MKRILIIGAGRSTSVLIDYLVRHAEAEDWQVVACDLNPDLARRRVGDRPRIEAMGCDMQDAAWREEQIGRADVVISMMPAHMHVPIAKDCIRLKAHLITASYISDEMKALHDQAVAAGVVLMNEIGVDPGIDHLSAMKVIDEIRSSGGTMKLFESFTGGLMAPESDDNPWNYKFTWNPRNVVLAGSGGAVKFKQEGRYKYIPYHQIFSRTEVIDIENHGRFEGYANRDSLKYRSIYGLNDIPTIFRGTLRRPGFCKAWDVFVQLGMTDDSYQLEGVDRLTHRSFINTFLAYHPTDRVELKLMHYLNIGQDSEVLEKLHWLDLFKDTPVGLKEGTPAQVLQHILEKKWSIKPHDRDMIIMWHKFGYELRGEKKMVESSMACIGDDENNTAMAKTVGLPVAIATRMILNGTIHTPGVHLPITREIYEPILNELEENGIHFNEREVPYRGY